jgi:hypothetical protein
MRWEARRCLRAERLLVLQDPHLDSLQRDRFFQLTRREALPKVMRGLEAIAAQPGITKVKVNALGIRGFTEEEVLPFCEFAGQTGFQVASSSSCPGRRPLLVSADRPQR